VRKGRTEEGRREKKKIITITSSLMRVALMEKQSHNLLHEISTNNTPIFLSSSHLI
jgi:hypothetical protein